MIAAIDLHTHFWPRGFLEAMTQGRSWYGWEKIGESDGKTLFKIGSERVGFRMPTIDLADPEARTQNRVRTQGVSLEAPMVVGFLWNYHLPADLAVRFAREVNQELSEVQKAFPANYQGLAILPMQDKKSALAELEYSAENLGLKSYSMASHVNGANLDSAELIEVIEEIARHNFSLSIHPEFFNKIGDRDRLTRHNFKSAIGAPAESGIAMLSLIYSGIFDRYPNFRVSFTHGGGFAPYSIGRNRIRWEFDSPESRGIKKSPEKYLGNCYVDCLVHDDDSFKFLLERVGSKRILVGTDFPFDWDHPGGAANWIRNMGNLSDEVKKDILWNTAAEFLATKVPYREVS
jgi:aminocarboxymuconate-semialdehyde decarboxylase